MSYNVNAPISRAFDFEDAAFTYLISGTINALTDPGKAVTFDTTAPNTVKLVGVGDYVIGRLETYENRTQEKVQIAGVSRQLKNIFPIATGLTGSAVVVVGSTVQGAGAGFVQAATTPDWNNNVVTEILTLNGGSYAAVEKI